MGMLSGSLQIGDANEPVGTTVSCSQMAAYPPLGLALIWVVGRVQDILLDVTEDRFTGIVVRTPLRQAGPLQPESSHHRARRPGFDRVGRIAIQGQPQGAPGIPSPDPPQKLADIRRPLAGVEGPVDTAVVHVVEQEQIEPTAGLLVALQDQALGRGGYDRRMMLI